MTVDPEVLERALATDLAKISDRFTDEDFAIEMYRALCNVAWFRDGDSGHVALSWTLAERLVNDLRADQGYGAMTLKQTGGEGRVARRVHEELGRLGWHHRPEPTDHFDDHHVWEARESPPPKDAGVRHAPPGATTEEERFRPAHEAAQANRLMR
jgi:hypothetical protein